MVLGPGRSLVTGATGFIGRQLVSSLLADGESVRALSRSDVGDAGSPPGLEVFQGDLTRPDSLHGVASGCRTVFHCAGFAHAREKSFESPHVAVTVAGTRALMQEAREAGVRQFVYLSSVKATGAHPRRCLVEDDSGASIDHYGETRREAENLLREAADAIGIHLCCLRPALVYGAGVKGNLHRMIRAVDRGYFPAVPETGNVRSMVHVHDLVRVIRQVADDARARGRTYHVTDGRAYSTREIYVSMAKALGMKEPRGAIPASVLRMMGRFGDLMSLFLPGTFPVDSGAVSRLLDSSCYSNARLAAELDFVPAYDLAASIDEMVAVYRFEQRGKA